VSKIQTTPKGFQDVLGLKNFGQNPSELLDAVRPIVDIGSFYAQNFLDIAREDITNFALNDSVALEVPNGESWYVYKVSQYINDLPTTNADYGTRCYIDLPRENVTGDPDAYHLNPLRYISDLQPAIDQLQMSQDVNVYLPSGATIVCQYLGPSAPGVGADLSIAALILRIRT